MPAATIVTKEELLPICVVEQFSRLVRPQQADTDALDWNEVHAAVGSFADEHSTL